MNMLRIRIDTRVISSFLRALAPTLSALIVACGPIRFARADCVPAKTAPVPMSSTPDDREIALERYKTGNDLLKKNDCEGALELFLSSRRLWPNRSNTKNAAICLFELGRYPEALALYEELLDRFAMDIEGDEHALIDKTIGELQKKILIVHIRESTGAFSIDDQACGVLPRAKPVYLMPGLHIFRVLRPGQPEYIMAFSGEAGTRVSVTLPKPPIPAPPPPVPGHWFVQASMGPALAWSGIGTLPVDQLQQATGLLAQAHGGYWLSNGTMVALTMGAMYFDSFNEQVDIEPNSGAQLLFSYAGSVKYPLYAPLVGITAGWGTLVSDRVDLWFRGGLGLMSVQSKNDVQMELYRLVPITRAVQETLPVDVAGRRVVRSVAGYATITVGSTIQVKRWHIGMILGAHFLLDTGAALSDVYVGSKDAEVSRCAGQDDNVDCVPVLRLVGKPAYCPAIILIPQLVIGF